MVVDLTTAIVLSTNNMIKKLILLILLSWLTPSTGHTASFCPLFLKQFYQRLITPSYQSPELTQIQRQAFLELKEKKIPKINWRYYSESNSLYFWYLLSKLPLPIIDYLKKAPSNVSDYNIYRNTLVNKISLETNSIIHNSLNGLRELAKSSSEISTAEKIEIELNKIKELSPEKLLELEKHFTQKVNRQNASNLWYVKYRLQFEYKQISRSTYEVTIGEHIYTGNLITKNGHQFILLEVPKDQFVHPAWNPLDFKYIQTLTAGNYQRKSYYPTQIGLDGKFYLLDGNHRYTVDSRSTLKAEVPFPPQSATIRNYLDDIGVSQPSITSIIDIYENRLPPIEIIPRHLRAKLLPNADTILKQ